MHHQLGAERLDEAHRRLHAAVGRGVGGDGGVLEVLGADADDDALAVVALQRRVASPTPRARAPRAGSRSARCCSPLSVSDALVQVHRRRPDERGDEHVGRLVVEVLRRVDLLQVAVLEHGDPVAHRHRLDLVVGDVDRGDGEVALEAGDLGPHLDAQLGVEVGQRLVHQERRRLAHDRPAHRHPLALAAGELPGLAVEVRLELEDRRRLAHPAVDLGPRDPGQLEGEADVVEHRHVGVQRVVLEHHRDVPVLGLDVVDDPVADPQLAAGDRLQTGDHAQGGRLPAAGRSDEHEELAVGDVEAEVVDRLEAVVVDLVDRVERDGRHARRYPMAEVRCDVGDGQSPSDPSAGSSRVATSTKAMLAADSDGAVAVGRAPPARARRRRPCPPPR